MENPSGVQFFKDFKADFPIRLLTHAVFFMSQLHNVFISNDPVEFFKAHVLSELDIGFLDQLVVDAISQSQIREVRINDLV